MGDCPVCSAAFDDEAELQSHVNAHFDAPAADEDEVQIVGSPAPPAATAAAAARQQQQACRQCGATVPAEDLDSHMLAHQLEQEDLQQLEAGGGRNGGTTTAAAAAAAAAAGTSSTEQQEAADAAMAAALAAAEWGDETGAAHSGYASDGSDPEAAAAHQAQLEELYFQELRAKYGFTAAAREGSCRLCGAQGHWARECPANPEVQAAAGRVLDPPTPQAIAAQQRRAPATALVGPGLTPMLAACLEAQPLPRGAGPADYAAALCGPVQHFGATLFSSGWGCGYNNMQMLASHLMTRPEAKEALFGGAGWVPDISALQAWLEAAWRAGFDPEGAEQLEGRVQGTHKWVGTTEAAALFRSFGLRARIVDFGAPRVEGGAGTAGTAAAGEAAGTAGTAGAAGTAAGAGGAAGGAAGEAVHPNVECDGCGQCPIRGSRFRSQSRPNYDLCASCHANPAAAAAGPYERVMPGAMMQAGAGSRGQGGPLAVPGSGGGAGGSAAVVADQLLDWVWRYFTDPAFPSSSSGSGGGAGASARASASAAAAGSSAQAAFDRAETVVAAAAAAAAGAAGGGGDGAVPSNASAKRLRLGEGGGGAAGPAGKQLRLQQSCVRQSGKPPLYFQHEGHSRTIIGIERRLVGRERRTDFTLLVLDPGTRGPQLAAALQHRAGWQRLLKRGGHTLRHGQYQLLWVAGGLAEGEEREGLKRVVADERYYKE